VWNAANGQWCVLKCRMKGRSPCDRLRGEIKVENRNLDDYIIVKSDGLALYHLAAMVDDHLDGDHARHPRL
jgi:glutamyl/glutaminyl-tRNA synthetase